MGQQQMSLALDDATVGASGLPNLGWRVAQDGDTPFDDDERFFEPWWPGAQAFLRLDGDRLELRTEHLSDPLAAFPDLRRLGSDVLAEQAIIEGTLLALDDEGRPDATLLRRSLTTHDAAPATGAFVATDLPWLDGNDMRRDPYAERRRVLSTILHETEHAVVNRGLIGEGVTLARAVASMGLSAISARQLSGHWQAGKARDAWLRLRVIDPTAGRARPFLVLLERLPLGD
jgi:bifunctional non-homologous end joining protein LigD